MTDRNRNFCLLSGFEEDIDRVGIRKEFGKFGNINKIYITEEFAKVYFDDSESCHRACRELNNKFGWTVKQGEDRNTHNSSRGNLKQFEGNSEKKLRNYSQSGSANLGTSFVNSQNIMNNYEYLDDEFCENTDYCDIHGNPLVLFQADSGEKYVNVEEVRKAGFAIFRRDFFNPLLIDRRQIQQEFELHLLSEAKSYILRNKAVAIDEEHILQTIERCKNKLLGQQPIDRNLLVNVTSENQSSYNRPVNHTTENDTYARPERISQQKVVSHSYDTPTPIGHQRAPNALSSKFIPTERNSVPRPSDRQMPRRNNYNNNSRENNGFDDGKFENRGLFSHKSQLNDCFTSGSNRGRSKSRHRDDVSETSNNSERKRKYANLESVDKIDTVQLDSGCYYDVKITHVEKDNIFWAHKNDASIELENMLIKLYDMAPELEDIQNPKRGQLALAIYEDVWCRARILNESTNYVHFLDYGNRHNTESLKVFPENLKEVPVLVLRFALNKIDIPLAADLELRVMIKKKYEDGTYLVDAEKITKAEEEEEIRVSVKPDNVTQEEFKSSRPVSQEKLIPPTQEKLISGSEPQETPRHVVQDEHETVKEVTPKTVPKVYTKVPEELSKLKNGDKVMLLNVVGNQFETKTKESVQKSKELTEYIKKLDKSNLLLPSVEEGQMVLCCKDGLSSLYRAVVSKKTSGAAIVRYLDYPGEEQLSINSLRNVDEFLASQPVCLLRSPEFQFLEKLGPNSSEYVFQLLSQKEKVLVVITDDGDFDFQLDDGTCLLEKIEQLDKKEEEPKVSKLVQFESASVSSTESNIKSVSTSSAITDKAELNVTKTDDALCVTYDDMDWIKLEVGSTENFLCYTLKDVNELTLISLRNEHIDYMEIITDVNVSDEVPYEPSEFEMIMVAYQAPEDAEPQWYRGVVLEKGENGDYSCQMVDFGNHIVVKSKDIRRFEEHMKDIPILGIPCECVGIPDNDAVRNKLKQLIPEGFEVKVVVKGFDELKYQIELPKVYEILKTEGLC